MDGRWLGSEVIEIVSIVFVTSVVGCGEVIVIGGNAAGR